MTAKSNNAVKCTSFQVGDTVLLARVRHDRYRGQVGTVIKTIKRHNEVVVLLPCGYKYPAFAENIDRC